jgi:Family of unknown function (DUF5681)
MDRYRPKEKVGYQKPPLETRFKKGQSGNPRGRPPRANSTAMTKFAEQLQQRFFVTENGRRRKVDKLELLIMQAINQAISGKPQLFQIVIKLLEPLERINKAPTKTNPRKGPLDGIDLSKLSIAETTNLYRQIIADSKPLD